MTITKNRASECSLERELVPSLNRDVSHLHDSSIQLEATGRIRVGLVQIAILVLSVPHRFDRIDRGSDDDDCFGS